jgi:hypothetical protein
MLLIPCFVFVCCAAAAAAADEDYGHMPMPDCACLLLSLSLSLCPCAHTSPPFFLFALVTLFYSLRSSALICAWPDDDAIVMDAPPEALRAAAGAAEIETRRGVSPALLASVFATVRSQHSLDRFSA